MNTVPLHHYVSSGGFASVCAFYVNELSSPMDVTHADVQLHLRKFLLSPNMFLSIAVVPHNPSYITRMHAYWWIIMFVMIRLFDLILYRMLAFR